MVSRSLAFDNNTISSSSQTRTWERKLLLFFGDLSMLMIIFYYCQASINPELDPTSFFKEYPLSVVYVLSIFWTLAFSFNLYDLEYVNKTRKVIPLSFFIGFMTSGLYIATSFIPSSLQVQKVPLFGFVLGFTIALIIWRVSYASIIHTNLFVKNFVLLVTRGTNDAMLREIKTSIEGKNYDHGLKILRVYRSSEDTKQVKNLSRTIERMSSKKLIDGIMVLDNDQESISRSFNSVLVKLLNQGIHVKTYFELYEEVKEAIPFQFAGNQIYTILPISRQNHNYIYLLWHKVINISASIIGLSIMALLTPLILMINLFLNKGPLFYSQKRVGKGGKEIEIIKFRSMIVGAEKHGAKMSGKGDLRITKFGKILRKMRIDELPQFWSVLKGEMSFIGPRPERKIFIDKLVKKIPLYESRHLIRPGITGWAQVKYEYGENIEDSEKKLQYDLYYIKNRSVTLDIRIIFKTINTIIFYKGQ